MYKTCLKTEGSPILVGTGTGLTLALPRLSELKACGILLFDFTASVHLASCLALGRSIMERVPKYALALCPPAGSVSSSDPTPLVLATSSFLHSESSKSAPGYHPVVITPSRLLSE